MSAVEPMGKERTQFRSRELGLTTPIGRHSVLFKNRNAFWKRLERTVDHEKHLPRQILYVCVAKGSDSLFAIY